MLVGVVWCLVADSFPMCLLPLVLFCVLCTFRFSTTPQRDGEVVAVRPRSDRLKLR